MKKENLDKRICDIEIGATNTETYREFILNASKEIFGYVNSYILNLDILSEEELNDIIDELDYLLEK